MSNNPNTFLGTVSGGSYYRDPYASTNNAGDVFQNLGKSAAGISDATKGAYLGANGTANGVAAGYQGIGAGNQTQDQALGAATAGRLSGIGTAYGTDLSNLGGNEAALGVGIGQRNAGTLSALGAKYGNQTAPQVSGGALDAYGAAANGEGPSGYGSLLTSGTEAGINAQTAAAAGARGNLGLANAAYLGGQNAAGIEQGAANNAAQLKAQELAQARAGLGGLQTTNANLAAGTQALNTNAALGAATSAGNLELGGFSAGTGAGNNLYGLGANTNLGFQGLGANTGLGYQTLGQNQGYQYNALGENVLGQQLSADVSNQQVQQQNNQHNADQSKDMWSNVESGLSKVFGGL